MSETQTHERSALPTGEDAVFAESRRFDADRRKYRSQVANIAIAWALFASIVAITAILFAALRPPTRIEVPYVAWIDSSTGMYTNVQRVIEGPARYNDMVVKTMINQYVVCREGYTYTTYNIEWEKCAPLASPANLTELHAIYDPNSPTGFYKRYGKTGSSKVDVSRIVPIDGEPDKWEAHFTLTENVSGVTQKPSFWVSQVKVAFNGKFANWQHNPLGMQVLTYRRDQEVVQ